MRRLLQAALTMALAAGGLPGAEKLDPNPDAAPDDQIRELFSEGVNLYRTGKYDEAALRFKDALKLDPPNRLVFEFYRRMGDRLLLDMQERAELEDVLRDVLRKARVYHKQLRTDPRYIELLIEKLRATEKERLAATLELVAIGPIAVPNLVDKLHDSRQEEYRTWCRGVLSRMGYRAVVPLVEALKAKDDRLTASVATILADIGDPRALPRLQLMAAAEGTPEVLRRVCTNAISAIAARSAMAQVDPSDLLHFQEAMRYFRDGDQVRDEMVANESLMWTWVEEAGDGKMQLQYVRAPRYAWNELMAEQILFDGASAFPTYAAYFPLLGAVLEAQPVEAGLRLKLAEQRLIPPAQPDESAEALKVRVDALAEMEQRVQMMEPEQLYRAVQQSIVSERYEVAIGLMRLLQDRFLAHADRLLPSREEGLMAGKAGTVLVAALEHPEKRIRYQAAATLAHLDPALKFFNADKVVTLLSEAVGEWGMLTALVIEADYRHRNTARSELQGQGLLAFTAGDGFEARQRLNESPIKDAIIIDGTLQGGLRDEHGVVIDVDEQTPAGLFKVFANDPRTAKTPIFISLPENAELSGQIRTAFEKLEINGRKVTGFVQRPFNGVEMKGVIESAMGDAALPDFNRAQREEVSLAAAQALGVIEGARSQFDTKPAADALATAIVNRADPIRIAALKALGRTRDSARIDFVTQTYESQAETLKGKPDVRAAFMECIGLLNPNTERAVLILKDALGADELIVRQAAAKAIGHGPGTPDPILLDFEKQRRLNARAAGNGESAPQP